MDSPLSPRISVLIPTYNTGRFLNATIESALRQTFADFEVIAVDDGSTDGTPERLKRFQDPRMRVVEQPHRGAPAALNLGLELARAPYIAFLDHDDVWMPEKLARHFAFFEEHGDVAVTFCWSGLIDAEDRRLNMHPAHWTGPIGFGQLLEDYVVGPSSSVVARREAIRGVGGFDVELPRCHDAEVILRVALAHPRGICAIPEELTLYRRHAGQMSRDWRAMHAEWNAMLEKCRRAAPADTAAVERRARSNINRYFAYLAYEDADFRAACGFAGQALGAAPGAFFTDSRNWKVAAACLAGALLPAPVHRKLEELAGIRRNGAGS